MCLIVEPAASGLKWSAVRVKRHLSVIGPANPNRRSSTCWRVRIALLRKPCGFGEGQKNSPAQTLSAPDAAAHGLGRRARTWARDN